jgi:quercetin dioxygenase-like cupin family protein
VRKTKFLAAAALAAAMAAGAGPRAADYRTVVPLLNTTETNIGQPLRYPEGRARVVSMIVTMQPGEATGRHRHPVPTYGHILEGEVTVDYGAAGTKVYRKGDSFIEAEHHWHDGRNTGTVPCRILVVFIGADGVPNVVRPK